MDKDLRAYPGARQPDALRIESLLSTAIICADGAHGDLLFSLIDAAHDAAKALNKALDAVSLPEGGDA